MFGLYLGVPHDTLATIQVDNPRSCQQCMYEMLAVWLKKVDEKSIPSWTRLYEALSKLDCGQSTANQIKEKHINLTHSSLNMDDLKHYAIQLDNPISAEKSEAGRGCFGVVYKSKINGAPCVVKKLYDVLTGLAGIHYESQFLWTDIEEKFQTEIRLLSQLRHPNIVNFLGFVDWMEILVI